MGILWNNQTTIISIRSTIWYPVWDGNISEITYSNKWFGQNIIQTCPGQNLLCIHDKEKYMSDTERSVPIQNVQSLACGAVAVPSCDMYQFSFLGSLPRPCFCCSKCGCHGRHMLRKLVEPCPSRPTLAAKRFLGNISRSQAPLAPLRPPTLPWQPSCVASLKPTEFVQEPTVEETPALFSLQLARVPVQAASFSRHSDSCSSD